MKTIEDILTTVRNTLKSKGDSYGPTYRRVATMLTVQPQYSILVRMLEKCARCHNLLRKNGGLAHLQEEFIDIACYAILAASESEPSETLEKCPSISCPGILQKIPNSKSTNAKRVECPICGLILEGTTPCPK